MLIEREENPRRLNALLIETPHTESRINLEQNLKLYVQEKTSSCNIALVYYICDDCAKKPILC